MTSDRFESEEWSLFVRFDSYEDQMKRDEISYPLGEQAELERYIFQESGIFPDELDTVMRKLDDGTLEISSDVIEFCLMLIQWIGMHTIPQEIRLVRNGDRIPT